MSKNSYFPFLRLLSALILCAGVSRAGVITINETLTLDPSVIQPQCTGCISQYYFQALTPTPFTAQAGDTVMGTVMFTNGPLHLRSSSGFEIVSLQFSTDDLSSTNSNSSNLNLLGLAGDAGPVFPGTGSGPGLVAMQVTAPTPVDFSFTGFSYSINIATQAPGEVVYFPYAFRVEADDILVGSTAAPEPSTSLLLAFGFGVTFSPAVWRRAKRSQMD
jgi:hypothetical protein